MSPSGEPQTMAQALPALLAERDLRVADLAKQLGITRQFLGRAIDERGGKRVGGELAGRVAVALGLPVDTFVEFREAVVIEAVRRDPDLRERIYRMLDQPGHRGRARGAD